MGSAGFSALSGAPHPIAFPITFSKHRSQGKQHLQAALWANPEFILRWARYRWAEEPVINLIRFRPRTVGGRRR